MLAPRKTLWSSPNVAVDASITLLNATPEDIVYDVGCGDGRFLIACAQKSQCKCVGLEIDEDRAKEAIAKVEEAGFDSCIY
jgi:cyclopropane fatty-acyl-phospholipid synthase-like methyltransferase